MRYVAARYNVISSWDLVRALRDGKPLPPRALIITFDEGTDAAACCNETAPDGAPQPGKFGPGGGRIGAVVISPFVKPGSVSNVQSGQPGASCPGLSCSSARRAATSAWNCR